MEAYLIAIFITVLIYMLLAGGLALQYGFTGLINFGHVGFYAIGAYTSALLSLQGVPLVACILAATLVSGLSAYPLGVIALRLRGDYLAIVTLGFSESVRMILQKEEWLTRGVHGIPGIPRLFGQYASGAMVDVLILATLLLTNILVFWAYARSSAVRSAAPSRPFATTKWPSWPWARTRPGSRRAP